MLACDAANLRNERTGRKNWTDRDKISR